MHIYPPGWLFKRILNGYKQCLAVCFFFYCRKSNNGNIAGSPVAREFVTAEGSDFRLRTLLNEAHSNKTHSLLKDLVMMITVPPFIWNYLEFKDILMMIYAAF